MGRRLDEVKEPDAVQDAERIARSREGVARRLRISRPSGSTEAMERLARRLDLLPEFEAWVRRSDRG